MHRTVLAGREASAREAGVMNQADLDVVSLRVDAGKNQRAVANAAETLVNGKSLSGLRAAGNPGPLAARTRIEPTFS